MEFLRLLHIKVSSLWVSYPLKRYIKWGKMDHSDRRSLHWKMCFKCLSTVTVATK